MNRRDSGGRTIALIGFDFVRILEIQTGREEKIIGRAGLLTLTLLERATSLIGSIRRTGVKLTHSGVLHIPRSRRGRRAQVEFSILRGVGFERRRTFSVQARPGIRDAVAQGRASLR